MVRLTTNILILFHIFLFMSVVSCSVDEDCESTSTDIHVTKEEYDDMGRLVRSCTGEVKVNKCEGMCNSQVQPSVISGTGFLKECFCCRENYLRERFVMLTHCYDPDGLRIDSETMGTMEIKLREPEECKCYKCGDYNR